MATTQSQRDASEARERSIDARWLAFAGAYLMMAGVLNLIWGITALTKDDYFAEGGLVWSSLNTWGWISILIAVAQIATGAMVYARRFGATLIAVLIAMCGMVVNFLSVGAYPVWSIVAIVCNALVLWAVTVHSGAVR
jgi:hypothetical protein